MGHSNSLINICVLRSTESVLLVTGSLVVEPMSGG